MELDRRVYRRELERLTGWRASWIRELQKRGAIPAGRVDEGGRRKWWLESEVREMVLGKVGAAPAATEGAAEAA